MMEEWKDITHYEGLYKVSSFGNIISIKGITKKPTLDKQGYHKVLLWKNNTYKTFFVHQLVANAFIDNDKCKKGVNHIDGNKTNNYLYNLEWNTDYENMAHAIHTGLVNNTGMNNGSAKLSESDVLEIDNLIKSNTYSNVQLATKYNVSKATIYNIKTRRKWKHLFSPIELPLK